MSTDDATMKAAETVPETSISGQNFSETVTNLPNLDSRDALSIRSLISKMMPTGFKVVVDLNFIPDLNHCLFFINHTPFYPPLAPLYKSNWLAIKNAFRPVWFDPSASSIISNGAGAIPAGISIVQYQEPNLLSLVSANHRFWMGSINYHIRVVCNFITTGYIVFTKLRNVPRSYGQYNQYAVAPVVQKRDTNILAGQQNSYGRTDLSMFRHMEITCPHERQVPVDMDTYLFERMKATMGKDTDNVTFSQNDDVMAFYADSPLTSLGSGGQIEFIIENCAGPDFQLYTPFPLMQNSFLPTYRLVGFDNQPTAYCQREYPNFVVPDVMPNPAIISDGIGSLTSAKVSSK